MMATELEFFLFEQSFDDIRKGGFRDLTPISGYNEDYHIFQTTKEEDVMRAAAQRSLRRGIPVESSKGEAEAGQEELNIRYAAALDCADTTRLPNTRSRRSPGSRAARVTSCPNGTRAGSARPAMCTSRSGRTAACRSSTRTPIWACRE